ncbi:LysR family transcriptional regulator [Slackia heliotrinireducens]|uniref:LysR family transcriptional regulator n=1 Tax=Slackia heliotrinireducens TaxID=84110 RepID=UPI0033160F5C
MDTRCMSYVDSLARTKNYSRSARELYITPQGLSSAIKRLEQSVGVPLFRVADGEILLTEYGEIFHRFSQRYLDEHANMVQEIEELRRIKSGDIRMAVSTGLFNIIPRDIAERFADETTTGARVSTVRSIVDNDCESGLTHGAWDFALLNNPVNLSLFAAVPLHKDYMFLWAPKTSPLAERDSVELDDLAKQTVVVLTPDEYVTSKGYAGRLEDELGCTVHCVDEMIGVLELAMSLDAFAIAPRTHAMAFTQENYAAVPIRDLFWGFSLCYRRDKQLGEPEREFVDFMGQFKKFYC